jgi:hypothetical protein
MKQLVEELEGLLNLLNLRKGALWVVGGPLYKKL